MNVVATRFFTKIARNPSKYYDKVIPVGFYATLMANVTKGVLDDKTSVVSLYKEPIPFTYIALSKSVLYGVFWPLIPFSAWYNTRSFFTLGSRAFPKLDQYPDHQG